MLNKNVVFVITLDANFSKLIAKNINDIHLIDMTAVCSFGLGRIPERNTSSSNDQNSKLYGITRA